MELEWNFLDIKFKFKNVGNEPLKITKFLIGRYDSKVRKFDYVENPTLVNLLPPEQSFVYRRTLDIDKKVAKVFGINNEGQVTIMIHCGSRGLGHQICTDYLREMERAYPDLIKNLPDRELVYAPAGSKLCKDYFGAMAAGANFAWCNRHVISDYIRKVFEKMFKN